MEIACERIEILRPGEPLAESKPEPLAKAELRELDGHFVREINRGRWVKAQINPDELRTSFSHEHGPSTRLDLRLAFDVRSPVPRGRRAPIDVRRLTEKVPYLATPRPARGRALVRPAVRLAWGTFQFDGHVDALEESLETFSADGRRCAPRSRCRSRDRRSPLTRFARRSVRAHAARSSVRAGRWKGVPWVVELALRAGRQA